MEHNDCRIKPSNSNNWNSASEYLLFLRHFAAYNFAKNFVTNKKVLEIGCGEGYGTNFLSNYCTNIIGTDIDKKIIKHASLKYKNLIFKQINENELDFKDNSFDIIICFQVIEHINPNQLDAFLLEIRRILKNQGIFICATPNKRFRLLPFQKPWNSEHFKEYDHKQLKKILNKFFSKTKIFGLYSKDDIQKIEKNRIKQNPLTVYFLKPLFRTIKMTIPKFLLNYLLQKKIKKINHISSGLKEKQDLSFITKYSINDFFINNTRLLNCMDLIGIGKKHNSIIVLSILLYLA
jgi:ubiquinone/menaquinone biosynthesis C-methylase UbiE